MYNLNSRTVRKEFHSQFASLITNFIAEKKGLGHKADADVGLLFQFDKFIIDECIQDAVITKEIFNKWCGRRPHESDKTHQMRQSSVNQLCRYAARMGLPYYVSTHKIRKNRSRFRPYIFTDDEILRFLKSADELGRTPYSPKRHNVIPMLFTILICTGLRLNEALRLKKSDVEIQGGNAVLRLYDTKFDKDRIVPLTENLTKDFMSYLDGLALSPLKSEYVFPAKDNGFYGHSTIYTVFRKILFHAGIPHGGRGKGPRIHDFRHTFAVKSLRNMELKGTDVDASLIMLSRYLGHTCLASTQVYLHLTAELFPYISSKVEASCGNIIPEVEVHYG